MTQKTLTLDAIHLIDKEVFLVNVKPFFNGKIYVDGLEIKNVSQFVISNLDSIEYYYKQSPIIVGYKNKETNEQVETSTYSEQKKFLRSKLCDGEYETLEDEYAHRKFLDVWQPIYRNQEYIKGEVKLNVTEIRTESDDPYIKSLWNSVEVSNNKRLYCFERLRFAKDYLSIKCSENEWNLIIPNHGGIRFAKINNNYIFGDEVKVYERDFIHTLEDCKIEKQRISDHIDLKIKALKARLENKQLINKDFLYRLTEIRDDLDKLRLKSAYNIVDRMTQLIVDIHNTL